MDVKGQDNRMTIINGPYRTLEYDAIFSNSNNTRLIRTENATG